MIAIDNASPSRRYARKLDRSFDGFRAGISEEHLVHIRRVFQQHFCKHAGQCRDVHLHKIRQVAIKNAFQRRAQNGMVAADRENAESRQQIEIARAIAIEQILPYAALEPDIVANGFQHLHELLVQVPRMHAAALPFACDKHLGNVKIWI